MNVFFTLVPCSALFSDLKKNTVNSGMGRLSIGELNNLSVFRTFLVLDVAKQHGVIVFFSLSP